MAVLDGQQRLTSIYVGLKGSYSYKMPHKQWKNDDAFPERKLYLNIVEPKTESSDKFEFKFLTDDECQNDGTHYWFLVGDILNMKELGDVIVKGLRVEKVVYYTTTTPFWKNFDIASIEKKI